jgi:hypothetical protein
VHYICYTTFEHQSSSTIIVLPFIFDSNCHDTLTPSKSIYCNKTWSYIAQIFLWCLVIHKRRTNYKESKGKQIKLAEHTVNHVNGPSLYGLVCSVCPYILVC